MKKLFFAIPFVMLSATATSWSQENSDPYKTVRVGIRAGYNSANLSITDNGTVEDNNAISSFNAGVYADLPIVPILSIQPGVFVSGKGAKYTIGNASSTTWAEYKVNPIYLEIPINAIVKIPFSPNSNIFFGAGPYAGIGIAGKSSVKGELLGLSFEKTENIKYGDDDPVQNNNGNPNVGSVKRFDFGFNGIAGVQISRLSLSANYGLGMVNTNPGSGNNNNDKYKNRVFSVSLGFLF